MATVSGAAAHSSDPLDEGILLLRWTYRRQGDTLHCVLALTRDYSAYELQLSEAHVLTPSSELFDDAISAFQRQASIERMLVGDGWHLERFDRERTGVDHTRTR